MSEWRVPYPCPFCGQSDFDNDEDYWRGHIWDCGEEPYVEDAEND